MASILMQLLAEVGIPVGVVTAPVIPGLTDSELEGILEAAGEAGAGSARYILLRLPLEVRPLFEEWLSTHYPEKAARVMKLVRDTRGGRAYDSRFGQRMRGTGPVADLIAQRFTLASKRLGLDRPTRELDCSKFQPPKLAGEQLELF